MNGYEHTAALPDCGHGIGDECKDWGDAGDPPPRAQPTTAQVARRARHPIAWMVPA